MGNLFCRETTTPVVSCNYCGNMPSDTEYVAKIFHKGKYNGVFMCKTCLTKKIKKPKNN